MLKNCIKLTELDIRDNILEANLSDLVNVIRIQCPGLKKLFIERSTKNKETDKPKDYAQSKYFIKFYFINFNKLISCIFYDANSFNS